LQEVTRSRWTDVGARTTRHSAGDDPGRHVVICADADPGRFCLQVPRRDTYESDGVKAHGRQWLLDRYCGGDARALDGWLAGERKIVLDAGCGAGYSAMLLFGERLRACDYLGVDISTAVEVGRQRFKEAGMNHRNFDWYRPLNCHRRLGEAGMAVERMKVEEAGITVVATKK
jgi:SAM-dependent methyltransferase